MIMSVPPVPSVSELRFRPATMMPTAKPNRITVRDAAGEPFRIFFPLALLAGMAGVSLWPLYFTHLITAYPGVGHARIMACGFFGAFILGFLGTAMPRMLSAKPFRLAEVVPLAVFEISAVAAFAAGRIFWGDVLWCLVVLSFGGCLAVRARARKDLPPPGFVLVGLALACVASGAVLAVVLAIAERSVDIDARWVVLQRFLSYQAFVLLPILGIGPFLLPRFFGLPTPEFPESAAPDAAWLRKAGLALGAGCLIVASLFLEAWVSERSAYLLRFAVTLFYFLLEMPLRQAPRSSNPLGLAIRISLAAILAGFLAIVLLPGYRVALLHLSLVGGFAVLTLTVATRVVFGHSGNLPLLKGRNRWLFVSIGLILFGMLTRVSGDFVPKILPTHYSYGALFWIAGILVWAAFVLPKVLLADRE